MNPDFPIFAPTIRAIPLPSTWRLAAGQKDIANAVAESRVGLPLRIALGLLLAGYGTLVLTGVMVHESALAGTLALLAGLVLILFSLAKLPAISAPQGRGRTVAIIGASLAGGVLLYNVARHSSLSPPEWCILVYGLALLAASRHLHRTAGGTTVATLVGWSFPLLLAPLALYAANGILSSGSSATAASPFVQLLVVQPAALGLRLTGIPTQVTGSSMLVATSRGSLSLGVGLVCAGLYPIVLFAGLVACHAWTEKLSARHAIGLVAAGVAGLWLLNLVRLIALARVGIAWGPEALQSAHANLGWILFALYMALFWALALRKPAANRA